MKTAILLHGTEGNSHSGWLQWLKRELESNEFMVWVPDLPRPDFPSLREWSDYVKNNCPFKIDADTVLVGHSAGAVAVLIVAQQQNVKVKKLISVASFKDLSYLHEKLNFRSNDRFFDIEFDFQKIKQNCKNIIFVHSDDDPYCPQNQAKYLAEQTGGEYVLVPGCGHFNKEYDDRFSQFPEILKYIT